MSLTFSAPQMTELKPRIVVIGTGGAGGNAVNNMIKSGLEGVDFIVANTDAQALAQSEAERVIQLGVNITQGLGCGARPELGRAAAEEAIDQIMDHLQGTHMAFITAGMGGGTGTGAAPVLAAACRERNILTVGVVTKPFEFEGIHRMRIAEQGIEELQNYVDTLIIIPNQNLFRVANETTTFADAFAMADNVLHSGVRGITDLMVNPGLINLDFADVKTVMGEMGKAMMGTGEAEGEKRATDAAEAAISNPLLDEISMRGARGVLINVTGGMDLTLYEVDEAANRIREEVDGDANIIFGSALDENLTGRMRVSVVATGIDAEAMAGETPRPLPRLAAVGGQSLVEAASRKADTGADVFSAPAGESTMQPQASVDASEDGDSPAPIVASGDAAASAAVDLSGPELDLPTVERRAGTMTAGAAAALAIDPEVSGAPLPGQAETQAEPEPDPRAPYIAPAPVHPSLRRERLGNPDAFRESEAVNPVQKETGRSRPRGLSLFGLMGNGRGSEAKNAARREPAVAANPAAAPPRPPTASAEPEVRTPAPRPGESDTGAPSRPAIPAQPEPAAKAPDLAPPRDDSDLLEIPSFLRRQAN